MGIGLQDIKSKINIVKEEMAQGTPKNIQKRILYEPKTVKSKSGIKGSGSGGTINKNNGGGNEGNNPPAPPDPDVPRPPTFGEWIFPPIGLWNMMFGKHDLQTGLPGAENPAYTQWKDQYLPTGGGNGGTKTSDPFSGALESMGTGLKLAGMAIPLMIGVMLLSQVKGLFK